VHGQQFTRQHLAGAVERGVARLGGLQGERLDVLLPADASTGPTVAGNA
jgi:hypothetical protein